MKCKVNPDEDIYKDIHIKSNCQYIYYAHFPKQTRDIVQKF